MRIIAGHLKNRNIITDKRAEFRPTMNKVREAIFNILYSLSDFDINDAEVLDLYAGSGMLGFEALSRGARSVLFIDNSAQQLSYIKKNAQNLNLTQQIDTLLLDATCLPIAKGQFSLIFIDPPYRQDMLAASLEKIVEHKWLRSDGIIVVEVEKFFSCDIFASFVLLKERVYSETKICILKSKE